MGIKLVRTKSSNLDNSVDNNLLDGFDRHAYSLNSYKEVVNVVPKRKITVLETFAGAWGLALGLEKAGMFFKGLIELDKNAAQTLRKNRPRWNVRERYL